MKVRIKRKIKKKPVMITGCIFVACLLIFFMWYFLFTPRLSLKGNSYVKVKYNEEYIDEGYEAYILNSNITDKVWTIGEVDTHKVGRYTIKYKVRKNKITITKERVVEVVDDEKPEITLTGENEIIICPNKEYDEEGYTALDNYDGDITDKVERKTEETEVIYSVEDSSGNKCEVKRSIIKEDKEPPKISLTGGNTIYLVVGNKYTEKGYTVIDNCDDNLSDKVEVSGTVDESKIGTYTLTYTVKDNTGNEAKTERKVIVQNQSIGASSTCGEPGVIYLTFDDGPQNGTTEAILDTLKKYNIKATFFVTGFGPDNLIKREHDEGHTVALHSNTHDYAKIYVSSEAYWKDLNTISARVERLTGIKSKLVRFPGGASNTVSRKYNTGIMTRLANEVVNNGYNYLDWNISSGDAGGLTSSTYDGKLQEEIKNVTAYLSKKRGNVVLMHDTKATTRDSLETIIKYGINNGYSFDVLNSSVICRQRVNN